VPIILIAVAAAAPELRYSRHSPALRDLSCFSAVFAGAFLLFQVQPIIAKIIVPWFGGTAAVWSICMLFFQVFLLAGYLYAHWMTTRLRPRTQAALHIALLAGSLFLLPILPGEDRKPSGAGDPTLRILALLITTIGLPYFLLSTTGPLVQAWYARSRNGEKPEGAPYRLFALSNAASLLALLSYPVLVEPLLAVRRQAHWWSAAYAAFVLLCSGAAWQAMTAAPAGAEGPAAGAAAPRWDLQLVWVALAACASALLLAITNHLSKNVAPVPLLWILPLSLYLLSFILCFEGRGWYSRDRFLRVLLMALAAMFYGLSKYGETSGLGVVIFIFSAGLFACCMVCHGELARLKPDPRRLTSFYLMVALGGALGGAFVALVAPYLFNGPYELLISLVSCAFLPVYLLYRYPSGRPAKTSRRQARWAMAGLVLALLLYLGIQVESFASGARYMGRNFYGALKVADSPPGSGQAAVRSLTHGVVNHGEQFLAPERRLQPTTYYGPASGIGLAIRNHGRQGPQRVGVIGLGAGVLASYGRQTDDYRFYEINPLVVRLAQTEFTFLRDSPAKIHVVLGDGRLSLEREPAGQFDVLAVDAFSGDSIPVHLLTKEAFTLYFQRLKPGGVLAVHISNAYLDLGPVVTLAAEALGKQARVVENQGDPKNGLYSSIWALVTDEPGFFENPAIRSVAAYARRHPRLRLWTDDYSNLLGILR
jgi:hypothetical protein